MDKTQNEIQFETPTYPELGNVYKGDYYEGLPFEKYIDFKQPIPQHTPEKPVFDIRDFGAVAQEGRLNTEAFQAAADACRRAGGGTILVREGIFLMGTVYLYDNTTLHIAPGAAIAATRENARMDRAFLRAEGASGLVITGGGKVCGNGEYYVYEPKLKPRMEPLPYSHLAPRGTIDLELPETALRYNYRRRIRFSEDKYLEGIGPTSRPDYMVWFNGCRNVRIENVIFEDAMNWTLNLFCCDDVLVKDFVINNNRHVANTDGIDVTGSSHVELDHCFVSTADDGIVLKNPQETGRDMEDIYIHNCHVITVMNAFKIGTETKYNISNVLVENCCFFMPDIYPGSTSGISIESADGSRISDITVRNITMDRVLCPLFLCLNMRNQYKSGYTPDGSGRYWGGMIEDVTIENINATGVEVPSLIFGFEARNEEGKNIRKAVKNIKVKLFKAVYCDNEEMLDIPHPIEEYLYQYPENNTFGDVDACGIWARHVDGLELEQVEIIPRSCNTRDKIRLYDVK
ncbi:glycoside hydrolase family 28 protein [Enterocloster hominis (ex Hitch et al. 2024)]|uniref:Glycosyl hydrolase family 28 protein n=1 Tax=Enterocloster hominis (ex Hitch et al. 2024) TaxID=1917870 RepID=A0ABV1D1R2_9FIRM